MKSLNTKYNNNATVAEKIFNEILVWTAQKDPELTKEQIIVDLEKILDSIEDRDGYYKKGYSKGYFDAETDANS